jgi:NhaP-type Na+/H+ or K+/H+ antiporter
MWGPSSGQLLAGVSEKTLELAGTSPTSALVGAALAYVGVRLVRRGERRHA